MVKLHLAKEERVYLSLIAEHVDDETRVMCCTPSTNLTRVKRAGPPNVSENVFANGG